MSLPAAPGFAQISGALMVGWRWWVGELLSALPPRLKLLLFGGDAELGFVVEGSQFAVGRSCDQPQWQLALDGSGDMPIELRQQLASVEGAALVLPSTMMLRKVVELPAAAKTDLQSASSFLIERISPFTIASALHSARFVSLDKARRVLSVEIAIVPKANVERLLDALENYGVSIGRIVCRRNDGDTKPFVFQIDKASGRAARLHGREIWKPVFIFAVVLGVVGPAAMVWRDKNAADELVQKVQEAQPLGQRVSAFRGNLEARAKAAQFLARRLAAMRSIEILEALTTALPDHDWLFRFDFEKEQIAISGYSSDVPGLLRRLSEPPFSAPELVSPVAKTQSSDKARFELRLRLASAKP